MEEAYQKIPPGKNHLFRNFCLLLLIINLAGMIVAVNYYVGLFIVAFFLLPVNTIFLFVGFVKTFLLKRKNPDMKIAWYFVLVILLPALLQTIDFIVDLTLDPIYFC